MKSMNPIAWWRRCASDRDSRAAIAAAEEELYALIDEASKVSAT